MERIQGVWQDWTSLEKQKKFELNKIGEADKVGIQTVKLIGGKTESKLRYTENILEETE